MHFLHEHINYTFNFGSQQLFSSPTATKYEIFGCVDVFIINEAANDKVESLTDAFDVFLGHKTEQRSIKK